MSVQIQLEVQLSRSNKIYHENEILNGKVVVRCPSETKHDGVLLALEGVVQLQLSNKNVGIFEAFYNSVKVPYGIHNVVL